MFIGVLVSAVLHGICLLQAFYYFTSQSSIFCLVITLNTSPDYKHDHWLLKGMVLTTCSFDAIHLCFVSHTSESSSSPDSLIP